MRLGGRAIAVALAAAASLLAFGQTAPPSSWDEPLDADSGLVVNTSASPQTLWKHTVYVAGAEWLRLRFRVAILGDHPADPVSSVLRITSLQDGATQTLNAESMRQWGESSAYFNGPAVVLELVAAPNGRPNRVILASATAGLPYGGVGAQSLCGGDNRLLSSDPRVCRLWPVGCTGWIFNDTNRTLLTAGHCASGTQMQVAEFNVPLSTWNGNPVHPPPKDQYAIDQTAVQLVNIGIGRDACYFGCYANSTTGLTPYQSQGGYFPLATSIPTPTNQPMRVVGYGTISVPVDFTWNEAQKVGEGPFVSFADPTIGYRVDTTSGNSGSPVVDNATGQAIGIHTHSGCTADAGFNQGTASTAPSLKSMLAFPLGSCLARLSFSFPSGTPFAIDPAAGATIRFEVGSSANTSPQSGTGKLWYSLGAGFTAAAVTQVSPNVYDAIIPSIPCGARVRFYLTAQSTAGKTYQEPVGAPLQAFTAYGATAATQVFPDSFDTDLGWSVSSTATNGFWERGAPLAAGSGGDAPTDYGGGGACFQTGNAMGDSDVDGGATTLTSPRLDLSAQDAVISYARWFSNSSGAAAYQDQFTVEISNDDGSSWSPVETVGPKGTDVSGGWFPRSFLVSDFVTPTGYVRVRFAASDTGVDSVVEAAIDDFSVVSVALPPSIRGTVLLEALNYTPAGQEVRVELREPGTTLALENISVNLDDSGRFSFCPVSAGLYDVSVQGYNWLRKVAPSVTVGAYGAYVGDFVLLNGDVDGNNAVDMIDMNAILVEYGQPVSQADINWDGIVDLLDLNMILINFGIQGDP